MIEGIEPGTWGQFGIPCVWAARPLHVFALMSAHATHSTKPVVLVRLIGNRVRHRRAKHRQPWQPSSDPAPEFAPELRQSCAKAARHAILTASSTSTSAVDGECGDAAGARSGGRRESPHSLGVSANSSLLIGGQLRAMSDQSTHAVVSLLCGLQHLVASRVAGEARRGRFGHAGACCCMWGMPT